MACSGCSSGRGSAKLPGGCKNNGACGTGSCNKLNVFDWLANMQLPSGQKEFEYVEVRFKNSRKEFYRNDTGLRLKTGDMVAVEASPGHDIGAVSVAGELARIQMRSKKLNPTKDQLKKIYRVASETDVEKWQSAIDLEFDTMHKARTIAYDLGLDMKISDVEYQGDKSKAIFYYTAEGRVDFRELIRKYADQFKIRVEMKQIGARQEASRLGGIGSCGRELCCSTWLTDFRSVSTSAARYQQLSLNPQKLAGQCGKLKCCLNYELDSYLDAVKDLPDTNKRLETKKGTAFHQKTDIFKRMLWYSYKDDPSKFIPVSADRVKEVIAMNKKGEKPFDIGEAIVQTVTAKKLDYENVVGQDDLTRFDKPKRTGGRNKGRNNRNRKKGKVGGGPRKPQNKNKRP